MSTCAMLLTVRDPYCLW